MTTDTATTGNLSKATADAAAPELDPTELELVADQPDAITLTGLAVRANHGVFDFERRDGQPFVLDVTAWLNTAGAAAGDDLAQTLHYGVLADEIVAAAEGEPVDLIETLAERIARVVLAHRVAQSVRVTVHKPEAPIAVAFDDVSITITRRRA